MLLSKITHHALKDNVLVEISLLIRSQRIGWLSSCLFLAFLSIYNANQLQVLPVDIVRDDVRGQE